MRHTHARPIVRLLALTLLIAAIPAGCAPRAVRTADLFHDRFERGAVASDHPVASAAGAEMLAMGGNAVDAAVAASFTLGVVRPYSCGIGGGGFMVVHLPEDPTHGRVSTAIDYRETSPYGVGVYKIGLSKRNGRYAVGVPGTVAGLLHALERYGTLDRETVMRPAIEAARAGFVVDAHYAGAARRLHDRYTDNPGLQDSRLAMPWGFFAHWGYLEEGDRVRNPDQARALELIARDGADAFYEGPIGDAIVAALADEDPRSPATMTAAMLASYEPIETEPIEMRVAGRRLLGMPPPSSGGVTMFQALAIMERAGFDFDEPRRASDRAHIMIEALKHAFADRARYLADPRYAEVPTDALLSAPYLAARAARIGDAARDPRTYGTHAPPPDDAGTSHVSAVDPFGGAVAMTETINLEFGSRVGVDGYGFVLNNELDDFTHPSAAPNAFGLVQSPANTPEYGKRPLSSMSPTIVLDEGGRVVAVAGASGGPRIISATMQAILNALAGMRAGRAVAMPRLHHQWLPDEVRLERGYSVYVRNTIGRRGHTLSADRSPIGTVQLVVRDEDGGWQAASDPRKGGRPAGVE